MKIKGLLTAFVVVSLGLTACAPVGSPSGGGTPSASAKQGNVILGIRAKSGTTAAAPVSVTLNSVTLTDSAGTVVVVTDVAQDVQLGSLKSTTQQILASATIPDGDYTLLTVTFTKADGTVVTKDIQVAITVASGKITNVVVTADPNSVASGNSPDMTADDNSDPSMHVDGEIEPEGTITAIADDKASFSFKMEHSKDSVTVKIVTGAANAADNTAIVDKAGNAVEAAALAVGDEVYVDGELDATTNEITAKMITVEHEDGAHNGDDDAKFALAADEALLKGTVDVVTMDATTNAVTSFTVTLDHAVGALPADATSVTVNVSDTTKSVTCGKENSSHSAGSSMSPKSRAENPMNTVAALTLVQGDKVFVRGTVVMDNGNATNVVNAAMVVVKPAATAEVKLYGNVTDLVDADKIFTLTLANGETQVVTYLNAQLENFAVDANLANGQKVKVEGRMDEGKLVANEIKFISQPTI